MSFDSPERSRHTVKHFVRIGPLMSYELRDISELIVILAHAVSFFDCRSITSGRRVYFCDKKINYLLFIGLEVEVDECDLTRTKYNRGRVTATLTVTILGLCK